MKNVYTIGDDSLAFLNFQSSTNFRVFLLAGWGGGGGNGFSPFIFPLFIETAEDSCVTRQRVGQ